jgi:hypothetical protein
MTAVLWGAAVSVSRPRMVSSFLTDGWVASAYFVSTAKGVGRGRDAAINVDLYVQGRKARYRQEKKKKKKKARLESLFTRVSSCE